MLGLLAVPYLSPRLARFRIVRAPWDSAAVDVPPVEEKASTPLEQGETALKASENKGSVTNALPDEPSKGSEPVSAEALAKNLGSIAIEDPTGHALDAFYAELAKTAAQQPGAVTRILHYGDSVLTSDYISGTMRRKMQAEFGDAGHGFLLLANPWEWYFHNDVTHGASDGWTSSRITGPLTNDGMYGFGGVSFKGTVGATAHFGTSAGSNTHGKNVSRFDVYYLETEGGGDVDARVGDHTERFSTKGSTKASRVKSIEVPDGEAKLFLRVVSGNPRMFGVVLERDRPGVVYDAIGINGARAELLNGIDGKHWAEQFELRRPSLVILQFGTNESEALGVPASYEKTLTAVVEKVRAAAPEASILVASPLDRAETSENGALRTKPVIEKLVAAQRSVALATKVAFFDTFEAMGGNGTMAKWAKKGLCGGDLTHPTPAGAEIVGDLFYKSLASGFEAWRAAHPDAPKVP